MVGVVERHFAFVMRVLILEDKPNLVPWGRVRKAQVPMRIARLLHVGDPHPELPRPPARLGLPTDAIEHDRIGGGTSDVSTTCLK